MNHLLSAGKRVNLGYSNKTPCGSGTSPVCRASCGEWNNGKRYQRPWRSQISLGGWDPPQKKTYHQPTWTIPEIIWGIPLLIKATFFGGSWSPIDLSDKFCTSWHMNFARPDIWNVWWLTLVIAECQVVESGGPANQLPWDPMGKS